MVFLLTHPLALSVRWWIVAKVDSMGLVVRNGVGGPNVLPVFGREIEEGQQGLPALAQAIQRFRVLGLPGAEESSAHVPSAPTAPPATFVSIPVRHPQWPENAFPPGH